MGIKMINNIVLFISTVLLVSCGKPEVYSEVEEYPNAKMIWDQSSDYNFTIENTESLHAYLHIQHNNDYPYRNIYFFSRVEWPDGHSEEDTLQYVLAKPNGEWLGSGIGASKKMYLHYPLNLEQKGDYKVKIWQAMRKDTLVGVEKLAFSIQRNES